MSVHSHDAEMPDAFFGEAAMFHVNDLLWSIALIGALLLAGNVVMLSIGHGRAFVTVKALPAVTKRNAAEVRSAGLLRQQTQQTQQTQQAGTSTLQQFLPGGRL